MQFELADGGTLFLDEIGEMPVEMQSVLLRALEENCITRIGATKPINVDVRIITATNKDLTKCIADGTFRADLYYRLNVINLTMIPLRRRKEDIKELAEYFLERFAFENGKKSPVCGLSGAISLARQCARAAQLHGIQRDRMQNRSDREGGSSAEHKHARERRACSGNRAG